MIKKDMIKSEVEEKIFEQENVVIAGNPAEIKKQNISWSRKSPDIFIKDQRKQKEKVIAVIPARYQSSRFPGKPLANICGKPMIQWVYERVKSISELSNVFVATDDDRIFRTVQKFGGQCIMTGDCNCGTERVYQACKDMDVDVVINIQGDEPLIQVEMVLQLIDTFKDQTVKMATLKKRIVSSEDIENPNIVKVITDKYNDAIYFSRSALPYRREPNIIAAHYKHIGIYGYKKEFLKEYISLPQSELEKTEQLEQLRAIENGFKIRVVETSHESVGVDLPEHIAKVELEMRRQRIV